MRRPNELAIGILLVGTILVAGCSGASSTPAASTETAPPTSTTTTTTVAPTTTTPPGPTQGAATSDDAAGRLVAAWNAHDRTAAAKIATPLAVKGIFATPDPAMWMRGCTTDPSLPQGGCVYRTRSGLVQINTEHRKIGWVVTSASFDAFADGNGTSGNAPASPAGQ